MHVLSCHVMLFQNPNPKSQNSKFPNSKSQNPNPKSQTPWPLDPLILDPINILIKLNACCFFCSSFNPVGYLVSLSVILSVKVSTVKSKSVKASQSVPSSRVMSVKSSQVKSRQVEASQSVNQSVNQSRQVEASQSINQCLLSLLKLKNLLRIC